MRKLKLFQKNFLYTFMVMSFVVFLMHAILYSFVPKVYLKAKHESLNQQLSFLSEEISYHSIDLVLTKVERFAYQTNTNIRVESDNNYFSFFGLMPFEIQLDETINPVELEEIQKNLFVETPGVLDQKGIILANKEYVDSSGKSQSLEMMMSIQPVHEITELIFGLLPYSLGIGIVISFTAAYFYSKYTSRPVLELLEITDAMAQRDDDAFFESDSHDEIALLGDNINKMYASLRGYIENMKEVEKEKEVFYKAASHELKTPLTSLSILLENMIHQVGPYQNRDYYLQEAMDLVYLSKEKIQMILLASESSLPMKFESIKIYDVIMDCLTDYDWMIVDKNLDMDLNLDDTIFLSSSLFHFKIILDNLIGNAIVHSPDEGTIKIYLDKSRLRIKNTTDYHGDLLSDQIYDAFYRIDASRNQATGGTGMGLYLVKKYMDQLDLNEKRSYEEGIFTFEIIF